MASGFYTDPEILNEMTEKKIPHETGLKQAVAMMAIETADEVLKQLNEPK